MSKRALKILIPFPTFSLCEAGFSALAVLRTNYSSRVDVGKEMRVAVWYYDLKNCVTRNKARFHTNKMCEV